MIDTKIQLVCVHMTTETKGFTNMEKVNYEPQFSYANSSLSQKPVLILSYTRTICNWSVCKKLWMNKKYIHYQQQSNGIFISIITNPKLFSTQTLCCCPGSLWQLLLGSSYIFYTHSPCQNIYFLFLILFVIIPGSIFPFIILPLTFNPFSLFSNIFHFSLNVHLDFCWFRVPVSSLSTLPSVSVSSPFYWFSPVQLIHTENYWWQVGAVQRP